MYGLSHKELTQVILCRKLRTFNEFPIEEFLTGDPDYGNVIRALGEGRLYMVNALAAGRIATRIENDLSFDGGPLLPRNEAMIATWIQQGIAENNMERYFDEDVDLNDLARRFMARHNATFTVWGLVMEPYDDWEGWVLALLEVADEVDEEPLTYLERDDAEARIIEHRFTRDAYYERKDDLLEAYTEDDAYNAMRAALIERIPDGLSEEERRTFMHEARRVFMGQVRDQREAARQELEWEVELIYGKKE